MAQYMSTSEHRASASSNRRLHWVSRGVMVFLGGVLILSGGIKALDLNLFVRQIQSYAVITQPQLTALVAWLITAIECFLGTALLVNYRGRQALNLTLGLLAAFTLLTLYAAFRGSVEDCGCFGALVKRTPMQAAVEDGVLLMLGVMARRGAGGRTDLTDWPRAATVGLLTLVSILVPFVSGVPTALLADKLEDGGGIWAELVVEGVDGLDLGRDAHLVVLMSAGCQHCQDAVPEVAMLMDELQSKPISIIGLGQDSTEDMQGFIDEWAPPYPIGRIDSDAFWTLLGDAELPRMILVKAGKTIAIWDLVVPSAQEIIAGLSP